MTDPKERAMQATALVLANSPSFLKEFLKNLEKKTDLRIKDVGKIVIELDKWKRIELRYEFGKFDEVVVYFSGREISTQKV